MLSENVPLDIYCIYAFYFAYLCKFTICGVSSENAGVQMSMSLLFEESFANSSVKSQLDIV